MLSVVWGSTRICQDIKRLNQELSHCYYDKAITPELQVDMIIQLLLTQI
jgi:hypothetical protein